MILVVGGTGSLGGRIVEHLRARGKQIRALVRPTSDSARLKAVGVQLTDGDLRDTASLDRACQGIEVVVSTASASKRGDDSIENVDLLGNQNLIDAAVAGGVRRFVFVSTLGASAENPHPLFRAKGLTEQRLRESGMEFTIFQPDAFMDVWFAMLVEMPFRAGQPVTLVGDSARHHSFVAEQDVAAFAASAVDHPAAKNATIPIGGPRPITFRDVVGAYETALGRSIAVRSVAPGEPIPGLPEPIWGIAAALESYDSPIDMSQTAAVHGVRLTDVTQFAQAAMQR